MEKLKRWALSGSFRYKLLLTSIACLLIPTLITLSMSNLLTQDAVKEQAEENANEQLKLIEGYLSNLTDYMLNISNYIIVDPDINTILKEQAAGKTYRGDNAEYREFQDRYQITSKIDNISIVGEKTYVTILLPNGRFFINYPLEEYDPRLLFEKPWFPELNRLTVMEAHWVDAEPSPYLYERTAGRHQFTVARTLRRPNFEIYAYVFVTVPDKEIKDIFDRLASGQEIMLVNGVNQIMAHLDPSRVGERLHYLKDGEGGSTIVEQAGEDYLLAQLPLSIKDWKLVLLTPYEQAVFKINQIFQKVFWFQLIAFTAFLVILILLIRAFTMPLVRLGKLAWTVQRGNLEVRSYIRGRDEIGQLGSSFDQMLDRIKGMIAEITAEQTRKRKAELAMLQAQINPHFLFNVLNSIRMKVLRRGDKESAEMLASLSRLLRMTIDRDEETITLHEEVSTAIDYVNLMNMRQKQKVQLEVDIASDTMLAEVPRFFLQPLIENAMLHGLQQSPGGIFVSARQAGGRMLEILVRDDGRGMSKAALERVQQKLEAGSSVVQEEGPLIASGKRRFSGIGLANVSERMRIRFGAAFTMSIHSEEGAGTEIRLRIPLQEVRDNHVQGHAGG